MSFCSPPLSFAAVSLAGDLIVQCLSALGQGVPQSSYKKTITRGNSCQLEGYTLEGLSRDKGRHTPMCLSVHTNTTTGTPSHTLDVFLCVYTHFKLTSDDVHAHRLLSPPSFFQHDGALHYQTTQNFSTHQETWSPVPRFYTALAQEVNPHPPGYGSTNADFTTCLESSSPAASIPCPAARESHCVVKSIYRQRLKLWRCFLTFSRLDTTHLNTHLPIEFLSSKTCSTHNEQKQIKKVLEAMSCYLLYSC